MALEARDYKRKGQQGHVSLKPVGRTLLASSWLLVVAVQPWCSLPHFSLCLSDHVAISLCVCLHLDISPLLKKTI